MMWLLWMAFGVLAVTAAYLLPSSTFDPWKSLNAAGFVAGLYVLALVAAATRRPFTRRTRLLVWIAALIVGPSLIISWTISEQQVRDQARVLSSIRARISRGIIADEISRPLLSALRQYYSQKGKRTGSLGHIFKELHPEAGIGKNIHKSSHESDRLAITVAALSDDEVILIAEEGYVKGSNPDFKNLNGGTGMVQERARLTARGVTYESEN